MPRIALPRLPSPTSGLFVRLAWAGSLILILWLAVAWVLD